MKLKVFGVNGPNLDFLAESGFPMFESGFVSLRATVPSSALTQTTEFKLVVSNGLEASAEGYFAKDLLVNILIKGLNEFFLDLSIVDELKVETAFISDFEPLDSDGNYTIVFSQRWQDGTSFALSRVESSSLTAASFTTGQYNVSSSNPTILKFAIPYSKSTSDTGLRRDPMRPGEIRLYATLTGKDLDGNPVVRERHIGFPPSNDFLYWIPVDFTERPVNSMFTYEMLVGKGFDFFSFGSKLGTVSFTTDKMMLTYQGGSFTEESNYFITPNGVLETFRMDGTGNRFDERRYFTANVNQDGIFGSYYMVDSFTGMEFPGATPFSFRVPRPLTMRMPFEVEEIWPAEEGSAIVGFTYGIPNHLANHFRQISVDALIGTSGSTEPFMPATEVFMPGGYLVFKNLDAPEFIRLMESNAGANPDMPLQEISNFLRDLRMGNQLENKVMVEGMGSMQSSCVSSMSTGPCGLIRLHGVLPQEPVTMNLTFFFLPTMSVQPNPENTRELMPLENGVIGLALGHPGAVQLGEYLPHRSTIRIQHHSYPRMFDSSGVLMLDPYTASERLMAFHGERPHTVSPELEMNLMGRLAESRLVPGNASRFWETLSPVVPGPVMPSDYHLSYLVETGLREGTATESETIVFARHSAGSILELANLEMRPGMMHPQLEFYTTSRDGTLMNTSGALWPVAVDSSFSSGVLTTVTHPIKVGSSVEAVFLDAHSEMSGPSGTSSGPMSPPQIYAEEVVSLIMGRFPHLSVKVGDIVTTVHDILVVRNISSSFPIRCEAGGCVRDMDPMRSPGEVEVNTLFLARGIGPVIMVETEKGAHFDPQVGAFQPKGSSEFGYASAFISGGMESPVNFREGELMPTRLDNPEMQLANKRFHIFRRSAMDFGRMDFDFGPWDSQTNSGMGTMIEFKVDRDFHPGQIMVDPTNNQPLIDEITTVTYSVSNGDLVVSFQEDGQNMMFRLEGVLPRIFGTRMSFNVYEGQNPKSMEIMEWYSSMEHANNFFFQFFNYPMVEFWAENSKTASIGTTGSGYNYHQGFFIQPKSSRPDLFTDPNDRINSFVIHGPGLPMEGLWFKGPDGYVSGGQPVPLQMALPEFIRIDQEGMICPMGNFFCLNSDQAISLPTEPLMYSAVFMTQMGNEAQRYDLVIPARPEPNSDITSYPDLTLAEGGFVSVNQFSRTSDTVTTITVPAFFQGKLNGAGAGYFMQEPATANTFGQFYNGFGHAEFMGPNPLVGTVRLPRLQALESVTNLTGIADVYIRDDKARVFRTRWPIQ
ncbi:MAG: hypothetical protein H3C47_15955 [Candidatus Cloacimonetes bacterium]|nr:hypothetical protein [Candidatus Cloacimonadota bacterium]